MQIRFSLQEQDYRHWFRYVYLHSPPIIGGYLLLAVTTWVFNFGVMLAVVKTIRFAVSMSETEFRAYGTPLVLVVATLATIFGLWRLERLLVRKHVQRPWALGEHELHITPEGVDERGSMVVTSVQWATVEKIVIAPHAWYAFLVGADGSAFIVPRRAFADQAALDRFHSTALAYWRAATTGAPAPAPPDGQRAA